MSESKAATQAITSLHYSEEKAPAMVTKEILFPS
jgi:hypothetical protein